MIKKLTLLAMAVAALVAFAVPAAAHATSIVTDTDGNDVTNITAVSTDTITITNSGAVLACNTVKLTLHGGTGHYEGTGTANGGSGTGAHATEECVMEPSGIHINFTEVTATVELDGEGTGSAHFKYTYDITTPVGSLHCTFTSTSAEVSYEPGNNTLTVEAHTVSIPRNDPGCPSTEEFHGTFHALDGNKHPVIIH